MDDKAPLPLVSVIVPVYNGEKTIWECLNSILKQTYKNYEVLVVDNNSNDGTKGIIIDFMKQNNNIRYIFEKKKGRGAARNKGVKESKGEIICMTDSDCVVPQDWIEGITRLIRQKKEKIVMGSEEEAKKGYWSNQIQKANQRLFEENRDDGYIDYLDTKNFAILSFFMKKLMFDSRLRNMEDFEFFLRVREISKVRFLPDIRVKHHHKISFSGWFKLNFNRAYWITQIYNKYKSKISYKELIIFDKFSLRRWIFFLPDVAIYFVRKPFSDSFFVLVSEIAWRGGILWGLIFKSRIY